MLIQLLITALAMFLTACSGNSSDNDSSLAFMEEIKGRGNEGKRPIVYRVQVPHEWIRRDPLPGTDLSDSTLSIVDFFIIGNEGAIRIAIHNFPSEKIEQRIPPAAQVARWERQFEKLDPSSATTQPLSFSGYKGLYFEGNGILDGVPAAMMGWSLQLADVHYRAFSPSSDTSDAIALRDKRSDVTIKATGPQQLMQQHKDAITAFVHSFELIEEIPAR